MYHRCITILAILLCLSSATYSKPNDVVPVQKLQPVNYSINLNEVIEWKRTDKVILITLNDSCRIRLSAFTKEHQSKDLQLKLYSLVLGSRFRAFPIDSSRIHFHVSDKLKRQMVDILETDPAEFRNRVTQTNCDFGEF